VILVIVVNLSTAVFKIWNQNYLWQPNSQNVPNEVINWRSCSHAFVIVGRQVVISNLIITIRKLAKLIMSQSIYLILQHVWNSLQSSTLILYFMLFSSMKYINKQIKFINYNKICLINLNLPKAPTHTCFGTGMPSSGNLQSQRNRSSTFHLRHYSPSLSPLKYWYIIIWILLCFSGMTFENSKNNFDNPCTASLGPEGTPLKRK
jgi:hypothetical protein